MVTDCDDPEFRPWTSEGAARLLAAADELVVAVRAHAEAVTRVSREADIDDVFEASEALRRVALAYGDAQGEYSGSSFPFGVLYVAADDDAEYLEDAEELPASGLTVLQRHDYAVTDEEAVLTAGRAAYLRVWPDDDEADAARDVTHLAGALYQLAHADGWGSLDQAPGLQPAGGAVVVAAQEWLLAGDPNEWPDELFAVEGETLFQQFDRSR